MNFFSAHPYTITLALVSAVVWGAGRYYRKKFLSVIGAVLSVAALVTFAFGY